MQVYLPMRLTKLDGPLGILLRHYVTFIFFFLNKCAMLHVIQPRNRYILAKEQFDRGCTVPCKDGTFLDTFYTCQLVIKYHNNPVFG